MPIEHPPDRSPKDRVMVEILRDDDEAAKVIPAARQTTLLTAVWDTIRADAGMQAAQPIHRAAMLYRLSQKLQERAVQLYGSAPPPT